MKIVVDNKIPYIRETICQLADEVVFLSGAAITADDVRDADVLVVRTRTHCDRQLLEGSKVQLVVTATIGYDHIDTQWLESAGIRWTNCPGCNSGSVAQYVECTLLLLEQQKGLSLHQSTIGIVGCGHVGSKVKAVAERLGMQVLICDPLLGNPSFVSLDEIERRCDVITFHVPLTREGCYATWHMADEITRHFLLHYRTGVCAMLSLMSGNTSPILMQSCLTRYSLVLRTSRVIQQTARRMPTTWLSMPFVSNSLFRILEK